MEGQKEYYAFISYKREDEKWAKWLQDKLEHYRFPTNLNGRTDLPKNIRPTFRDVTDLSPEPLEQAINNALLNSEWLIVICSPRSAKSPWVCKEAQTFIDIGRADHIIPFVIEGNPFSTDTATECYPEALLNLTGSKELLAANINEMGRDAAAIKVVARMFGLKFDTLWQRHERTQKRRKNRIIAVLLFLFFIACGIAGWMINKDWEMMKMQARVVAKQADLLISNGDSYTARLICLDVLPSEWIWKYWPNRPFVPEVETALRNSIKHETAIFKGIKASISPDGKKIAAVSQEGHIMIYNSSNGALEFCSEVETQYSHSQVWSLGFCDNGKLLAYTMDKTLKIRDVATGRLLHTIESEYISDTFFSSSFSPNGSLIAVGAENGEIRVFEVNSGKELTVIKIPNEENPDVVNYVRSVVFSADGSHLLSGSVDGKVRIINLKTLKVEKIFFGHDDQVVSVAYSPDEKRVASVSWDNKLCIWDVFTGSLIKEIVISNVAGDGCSAVVYRPDGSNIAVASSDHTITILDNDGNKKQTLTRHIDGINSLCYYSNGKYLLSGAADNTVRIWDLENCQEWDNNKRRHSHVTISKVSFSPDGEKILSSSHDATIKLWNIRTGDLMKVFEGHDSWVRSASFSPNGKYIASVSDDQSVKIWDIQTGKCLRTLQGHEYWVWDVAFSPNGNILASASADDDDIRLWNMPNGTLINILRGHSDMVDDISFSKDGALLVSASRDSTVRVWNIETGNCIKKVKAHNGRVTNVIFGPNDKWIISAGKDNVKVWDYKSMEYIMVLDGYYLVACSDDGKIAFVKRDNSICIMDCFSWKVLRIINRGADVSSITFSPDGKYLVSSSDGGTIQLWDTEPLEEIVHKTRTRFSPRKLTSEERKQNYLE